MRLSSSNASGPLPEADIPTAEGFAEMLFVALDNVVRHLCEMAPPIGFLVSLWVRGSKDLGRLYQ